MLKDSSPKTWSRTFVLTIDGDGTDNRAELLGKLYEDMLEHGLVVRSGVTYQIELATLSGRERVERTSAPPARRPSTAPRAVETGHPTSPSGPGVYALRERLGRVRSRAASETRLRAAEEHSTAKASGDKR